MLREWRAITWLLALSTIGVWVPNGSGQSPDHGALNRLTPEAAISLRSESDFHFSRDGKRVAFVVSEPPKEAAQQRHIWVLDVKSRQVRQFTDSEKSETSPRWSPDGQGLAFLTDRKEFRQIYFLPSGGGEAYALTEGKRSIESFEWSPDGKEIAFLASEPKTEAEEKKEKGKDDAHVVDRDDKRARLWLLDVASRKIRQVTADGWEISEAQWLPSGDRLVVSATDHPESDEETRRIFVVNLADGKMLQITAPHGPFGNLRVSPDGKMVSFLAARVDGPNPDDIYVQPIDGGASRNLTGEALDRRVFHYLWQPHGEIMALSQTGFQTKLCSMTLSSAIENLEALPVTARDFDFDRAGDLIIAGGSFTEPEEVWLQEGKLPAVRVSNFNEPWAHFTLSKPEVVHYKSFDQLEIEAALYKPLEYDGHSRVPLVVLVHGGPTGAWLDTVEAWAQLLAAKGFAVLCPNVRGSTGYGQKFVELNRGDWGGGDFRDVMAGVDWVIEQGLADSEGLGIGGWSYGGYMAEWAITQTSRFKAAVSGAGMSDLMAEFGTEEHPAYDEWFYGLPYEKPEGFLNSSPIIYMRNARTPTLILQGETDVIDPLGQSQELYRALKHYGVKAEFVKYPREGHGLHEEKHLLDRVNRIVAWFETYLKTSPTTAGQSP